MKKTLLIILLTVVIIGSGAFYGGMKYGQKSFGPGSLSNEDRQRFQQMGGNGGLRNGISTNANFSAGEIIAKDNDSVTVKLQNGGSKIIFFSDSTEITKSATGTPSDLELGKTITVNGTTNQDGSITAKSIQIRPGDLNPQL